MCLTTHEQRAEAGPLSMPRALPSVGRSCGMRDSMGVTLLFCLWCCSLPWCFDALIVLSCNSSPGLLELGPAAYHQCFRQQSRASSCRRRSTPTKSRSVRTLLLSFALFSLWAQRMRVEMLESSVRGQMRQAQEWSLIKTTKKSSIALVVYMSRRDRRGSKTLVHGRFICMLTLPLSGLQSACAQSVVRSAQPARWPPRLVPWVWSVARVFVQSQTVPRAVMNLERFCVSFTEVASFFLSGTNARGVCVFRPTVAQEGRR